MIVWIWTMGGYGQAVGGCAVVTDQKGDVFCFFWQNFLPKASQLVQLLWSMAELLLIYLHSTWENAIYLYLFLFVFSSFSLFLLNTLNVFLSLFCAPTNLYQPTYSGWMWLKLGATVVNWTDKKSCFLK